MKTISLLILLLTLAGCDAVDSMTEGFNHTQEVANEIEQLVGIKPFVGFNWKTL
jgi:Tfp pilus assembly protein PilP